MSWIRFISGRFLVDQTAEKHWKFILFLALLAMISIASSHRADRKVFEIARLRKQLRAQRAVFVRTRAALKRRKLPSSVAREVEKIGLRPPDRPPEVLYIDDTL